jgi:uncharacterized protein YfiM (DUF2279 family)
MRTCLNIFIFLFISAHALSQDSLGFFAPASAFHKTRFLSVAATQIGGYGTSLALLSTAWYKDYKQTSFHSFNDGHEWMQMDKAGHMVTAWYLGRINSDMYQWSGIPRNRAAWYGAGVSFLYLTGIEVLDGFSQGWGFSWRDIGANALGTGLFISQQLIKDYKEHLVYTCENERHHTKTTWFTGLSLKYSFHKTDFPEFRPSLLGKDLNEQMLKDYNGQTYWISYNLSSTMLDRSKFPKWLNVALGYGAEGMISGRSGYAYTYPNGNTIEFERYRQYYFSFDIDLTRIKTRSHFLKAVFETFSFIKIPSPSLEFNKHGMRFHPLYY